MKNKEDFHPSIQTVKLELGSIKDKVSTIEDYISDLTEASTLQNNTLQALLQSKQYVIDADTKHIDTLISICKSLLTIFIPVFVATLSLKDTHSGISEDTIQKSSLVIIFLATILMVGSFNLRSRVIQKYKKYHTWVTDKISSTLDISHSKAVLASSKAHIKNVEDEVDAIEKDIEGSRK